MIVPKKEAEKISYIDIERLDDRVIPLQPRYLGDSKWEHWALLESGVLVPIQIVDLEDGYYFSNEAAKPTDLYVDFMNFVLKHAYFDDLVHFTTGILEDLNNLSASVEKINTFHELWRADKSRIPRRFVTSELEYMFTVCRSLFDLLQEVIMSIWSRCQYDDQSLETKKLKPKFSSMVLYDNKLSTPEEIASRYLIPIQLAEFYGRTGKFFCWLRSYRDKISHGGNSIDSLYMTDEGFAVSTHVEPFKGLRIWDDADLKKNDLGSVRSVVAYTVLNTLRSLDDFAGVFKSIIRPRPDIAPEYNVYVRGENLGVFLEMHTYVKENAWIKT